MAKERTAQQPAGSVACESRVAELGRDLFASIVAGSWPSLPRQPEHIAGECLRLASAFYDAVDAKQKQEG